DAALIVQACQARPTVVPPDLPRCRRCAPHTSPGAPSPPGTSAAQPVRLPARFPCAPHARGAPARRRSRRSSRRRDPPFPPRTAAAPRRRPHAERDGAHAPPTTTPQPPPRQMATTPPRATLGPPPAQTHAPPPPSDRPCRLARPLRPSDPRPPRAYAVPRRARAHSVGREHRRSQAFERRQGRGLTGAHASRQPDDRHIFG